MNHLKACCLSVLTVVVCGPAAAAEVRHEIDFPDLEGYQTIACDLHMHTVFSDGLVWPTLRVAEAWRQGLDAISITDHIEYQPHQEDVPTSHNRPYDLALEAAETTGLLLVKGAEITRDTPPGHFNAIFLDDIKPLETEQLLDAIQRANKQGAFLFWNHHAWQGPEKGRWLDLQTTIYNNKWLHGLEVCNGQSYYGDAHKWCLEKNLTMIGSSDIHESDLRLRNTAADHRSMTLVFVEERTRAGLRTALKAGRTVVWYKDQLIGRKEWLAPLFNGSIQVVQPIERRGQNLWVQIRNTSAADIQLERIGKTGPEHLTLPAKAITLVKLRAPEPEGPVELQYQATNFLIAPATGLPVVIKIAD
jgi:3',5'-nucleoside bisphosphate phosphatase